MEALQKELEAAQAKIKELELERDTWRKGVDTQLTQLKDQQTGFQSKVLESQEALKNDVLAAHGEVLKTQDANQNELRRFMTETLEMVESSLEARLRDVLKEEGKNADAEEALKQIVLQAHEELYESIKSGHQEQKNFMTESLEMVERALEHKMESSFRGLKDGH